MHDNNLFKNSFSLVNMFFTIDVVDVEAADGVKGEETGGTDGDGIGLYVQKISQNVNLSLKDSLQYWFCRISDSITELSHYSQISSKWQN